MRAAALRHPRPAISVERGFTLLELLFVVVIAGIMMSVALPNLTEFIRGQRVRTTSLDLYAGLVAARSEAINRNVPSTARISIEPVTACGTPPCDWAGGWQIKQGAANIQVQESIAGVALSGPTRIEFDRTGRAAIVGGVGNFSVSADGTPAVRCVTLDSAGRPNSKVGACI